MCVIPRVSLILALGRADSGQNAAGVKILLVNEL